MTRKDLDTEVIAALIDELYPKDCVLALYSSALAPGSEVWDWRHALTSRTTPRSLPFEVQ